MSLMCVAGSGLWGVPGPPILQQEAALRSPGDEYLPGIASEFGACATFLVLFLWRRINDQLPRSTYFQASWKVYCTGAVLFFICIAIFHAETWSLPPEPDPHFRAASRPIWPHLCGDAVSATCLTLLHRPIEPGHW